MTFATMQAGGGGFAERWRITNTGEFQAAAAQTISTAAGNLTLSAAGGNDLFLGNAVTTTMVVLDGGLDHIGLWQGPSSSRQLRIRYPAESVGTESSFYRAQHAPAGTLTVTGVVTTTATVAFNEPNITESGGSVVTAATVYIGSAPTEATNNYGFFLDSGLARFDGDGTHVFELPADATGNATAATGRIAIDIGGATKYLRYYDD